MYAGIFWDVAWLQLCRPVKQVRFPYHLLTVYTGKSLYRDMQHHCFQDPQFNRSLHSWTTAYMRER